MLSVAVLLAWQFFYAGPKLKEEQERQARIRQEQQAQAKEQTPAGAPTTTPDGSRRASKARVPGPASVTTAADARGGRECEPARAIETPSIKGSIALKGGRIDDVVLAKYRETVDPGSPNVVLFSPSGAPHPYYAEYGWVAGAGVTQPMPNARNALARREGRRR